MAVGSLTLGASSWHTQSPSGIGLCIIPNTQYGSSSSASHWGQPFASAIPPTSACGSSPHIALRLLLLLGSRWATRHSITTKIIAISLHCLECSRHRSKSWSPRMNPASIPNGRPDLPQRAWTKSSIRPGDPVGSPSGPGCEYIVYVGLSCSSATKA